jgi:DNA-binding MarR family transcriptional regulator
MCASCATTPAAKQREASHEAERTAAPQQRTKMIIAHACIDGLVKFIDDPKHRRSKLVRLTRKGDARYRELNARFLAVASSQRHVRKQGAKPTCHGRG